FYLVSFCFLDIFCFFFFFQAEDGIRDDLVTGVQTCALPIFHQALWISSLLSRPWAWWALHSRGSVLSFLEGKRVGFPHALYRARSEERRVGKECRCRWSLEP